MCPTRCVSSYYCVLPSTRRIYTCAIYVSSYYYFMCPQLILLLHAGGRVCVEMKNTLWWWKIFALLLIYLSEMSPSLLYVSPHTLVSACSSCLIILKSGLVICTKMHIFMCVLSVKENDRIPWIHTDEWAYSVQLTFPQRCWLRCTEFLKCSRPAALLAVVDIHMHDRHIQGPFKALLRLY